MYCIISTVQYCHFESNMIRYGTVRYGTVQYSTVQYSTVQYSTVQYSTVRYGKVRYGTVRYVAAKKNNYTTINQFLNLTISNY